MSKHEPTATQRLAHHVARAEKSIALLTEYINAMKGTNTNNWAQVGDVEYVANQLRNATEFLRLEKE